jgi:sugar O-acyltransferase (sialic acid O-acetyltransferase NeuD family)
MINKPIVIIGGGGHSRVIVDSLQLSGMDILGYTDMNETSLQGPLYMGKDEKILDFSPDEIQLANGIGSIGGTNQRQKVYEFFNNKGYSFCTVIHPSSIISTTAHISEGAQVMAGAVIQAGAIIGNNSIINTRALIDHDSVIGSHVHVASGAVIAGSVHLKAGVHVGCGATIIQNITVYENSIIGAGAVVIHDAPANRTYIGVPAKEMGV